MRKVTLTEEDIDRLHEVAWAASKDEARPQLCAVQLYQGWAVATDSYRLAAVELEDIDAEEPLWLSRAALNDLPSSGDCTITVRTDRRSYQECSWHVGAGTRVAHEVWVGSTVRPIEWLTLAAKPVVQTLRIDGGHRSEVVKAVQACKVKPKSFWIPPVVLRSTWMVRLVVEGPDHSKAINSGVKGGFCAPLGFNPRYLLDLLRHHAPGDVTLQCTSPITIGPAVATDAFGVVHLLMPVRLALKIEWGRPE